MTQASYTGQCACGHMRYSVSSPPMYVHCCHCRACQRETGTAFAVNALIEADRVTVLQGETETTQVPSASGAGQKIVRCAQCRTPVWSHYALSGGIGEKVCFVRVGTLDESERFPPDIHIYTAFKMPWVVIPEAALAVDEYYSAKEIWPEESLARRAALFDKT